MLEEMLKAQIFLAIAKVVRSFQIVHICILYGFDVDTQHIKAIESACPPLLLVFWVHWLPPFV